MRLREPGGESSDYEAGTISVLNDNVNLTTRLFTSAVSLKSYSDHAESRVWVRLVSKIQDLEIYVEYAGSGSLVIYGVTFTEKLLYRYTRLIVWIILLCCMNLAVLFFTGSDILVIETGKKKVIFCLALIVLAASLTYFTDFLYYNDGQDLKFHLSRISYLAEAIMTGNIPQRIQFTAYDGYGYAAPLYYGELFLYLPAILYCLWIPLQTCYQIYAVAINALTCGISYYSFQKMSGSRRIGLIGACMYTLSAWRMIDMLTRAAVGEYTAMAFLPLLVYGFYNLYRQERDAEFTFRDCIPIVVGLSGILQSHILTVFMSAMFILAVVLIFWRKTFAKSRFCILALSAVTTVLLNLWFLLPMADSMMNMDLKIGSTGGALESSGAYLIQIFGVFMSYIGENVGNGMRNEMPLTIGITLTLVLLLYLAMRVHYSGDSVMENDDRLKQAGVFAVLGLTAIFLSSNLFWSDTLFKWIPVLSSLLGKLQFPWRLLAMATVFLCALAVLLLTIIYDRTNARTAVRAGICLLLPGLLSLGLYVSQYADSVYEYRYYNGLANMDTLYLIEGTDTEVLTPYEAVINDGTGEAYPVTFEKGTWSVFCRNSLEEESYLTFPVFSYSNYHAYDPETGEELAISSTGNNCVSVLLPGGFEGTVLLRYEEPLTWRISEVLSLITMVILILLWRAGSLEGRRLPGKRS